MADMRRFQVTLMPPTSLPETMREIAEARAAARLRRDTRWLSRSYAVLTHLPEGEWQCNCVCSRLQSNPCLAAMPPLQFFASWGVWSAYRDGRTLRDRR